MTILDFGNTWWGQKWLQALRYIDYSNRLPRGKAYARNGYVKNVGINQNTVNARVQGATMSPYRIKITIPEFPEYKKEIILKIVTENPFFLSKLLAGELVPDLYDALNVKGIILFPSRWGEIDAYCSCPDSALPCKHIASVIYIMANEIDRNPFLVFDLHNFDIRNELKKLGYDIVKDTSENIRTIESFLHEEKEEIPTVDMAAVNDIDFSKIPDLKDQLLQLLPDNPIFSPELDFKKTLQNTYNTVSRKLNVNIEKLKYLNKPLQTTEEYRDLIIVLNNNMSIHEGEIRSQRNKIQFRDSSIDGLIGYLEQMKPNRPQDYTYEINALYMIYRFCIKLLEKGAYIPDMIKTEENKFKILWFPALFNEEVKNVFEKIKKLVGADFLRLEMRHNDYKKTFHMLRENQILLLCSVFITEFIKLIHFNYESKKINLLFFNGAPFIVSKFEEREIPNTINLWLSRFHMRRKDFVPLIKIDDRKDEFVIEILVENIQNQVASMIKLKDIMENSEYIHIKAHILKTLTLLSEYFPQIEKIIASGGKDKVVIAPNELVNVFFRILPVIRFIGIPILLPKGLKEIIQPNISLSLSKKKGVQTVSYLSLDKMLEFNWQIALGNQLLNTDEFLKLVKGLSGIVKLKGQYVYLNENEIKKIIANTERTPRLSSNEVLQTILTEEYWGSKIKFTEDVHELMLKLAKPDAVELPEGLTGSLREYQKRGYEWMLKNTNLGFGSIIADDMGLGKTCQVLAMLLKLKQDKKLRKGKILVIAPTTLLTNWGKEILKFTPDLKYFIYHGQNRKLENDDYDMLLTTYGIIRQESEKFSKHKWKVVVIDEAQNIKNPHTAQTMAVKKLKSEIRIAMSGTPVENRLTEYWSIFDFVNAGYLGNLNRFKENFALPIEQDRNKAKLEQFKQITAPFVLRRLKADKTIIADLPDKIEIDEYCNLTQEQTGLYQNVLNQIMKDINSKEGIERKGLVFKLMTALKQICNHPAHYLKKKDASPELSGKIDMLFTLLEDIYANDGKVLIFTQYKEMGDLLTRMIEEKFQTQPLFLHGGIPRKSRDKMVDSFQNEKYIRTFILSLKAGGTGLNLTAATNVIHYDLWWNPAVEAQATDRAYRIGQNKNVMVHRLISQGTFEEKINDMIKKKKELADITVSSGEQWIGSLSNDELKQIFKLDI